MRFTSPNLRQLQHLPNIQEGGVYILFQPKPARRCYADKRPTVQPERFRPSEHPNRSADVLTDYLRLFQADTLPTTTPVTTCWIVKCGVLHGLLCNLIPGRLVQLT